MSALRTRGLIGATLVVAVLGVAAACGDESSTSPPAAQPTDTPTTPGTPTPSPSGTPSTDCPETIAAVRGATGKAVWGKGAATSAFNPVSVTICQYDAAASAQDYATVTTKRSAKQATELFGVLNAIEPVTKEPTMCTKELGPTYVLRFTDNDRGVLSYTAEAFGCHRLVATSLEGQGKPGTLPAPRQVTPALIKSLGLR